MECERSEILKCVKISGLQEDVFQARIEAEKKIEEEKGLKDLRERVLPFTIS